MKVAVHSILVHERVRKEVGDLKSLMASMEAHGQLNPVTLTRGNVLVAGHRRLIAARNLSWQYIDAHVIERDSELEQLELELEENIQRKDFSPEEMLEGLRRLEKLRRPSLWTRFKRGLRRWFDRIWRRKSEQDDEDGDDNVWVVAQPPPTTAQPDSEPM